MKQLVVSMIFISTLYVGSGYSQEHSDQNHGEANQHMNSQDFTDLVASFESSERAEWQKPDAVIAKLGELTGKTVMDIGSGTGYFSFRLLAAGATVICADVDDRFLNHIKQRKDEMGISDEQMILRKVPYDSSTLQPDEVDMAIIVDTYHHIENRVDYFSEVRAGLRPGGELVVVDFKKEEAPVGPPIEMKMTEESIMDELALAGFIRFDIDQELLPYQYIIRAKK